MSREFYVFLFIWKLFSESNFKLLPHKVKPRADLRDRMLYLKTCIYLEEVVIVFIINNKDEEITNVMVSSNGYGEIDNKKIQTSTLRWFFD